MGYIIHTTDRIFNSGDKDSARLEAKLKQEPEDEERTKPRVVNVATDQYDCTCGGIKESLKKGAKQEYSV
jgi:hypothetical protein